jgi:hypothetical protein
MHVEDMDYSIFKISSGLQIIHNTPNRAHYCTIELLPTVGHLGPATYWEKYNYLKNISSAYNSAYNSYSLNSQLSCLCRYQHRLWKLNTLDIPVFQICIENANCASKARVKRQTFHVPNLNIWQLFVFRWEFSSVQTVLGATKSKIWRVGSTFE